MKKYIFYLIAFIIIYANAMYFTEKYTSIKPAGTTPARLSDFFVTPAQQQAEEPLTEINIAPSEPELTPEERERIVQAELEQKKIAEEKAKAESDRLKKEQEKRDALFKTKNLINIESLPVKLFLDMRYATEDNFARKKLYNSDKCYLQKDTAQALVKAAQYALEEKQPFYLCIYDCYRPIAVQEEMWKIHPVPGQVANPKTGSNHNRGTAIDLGPCDATGYALTMPTPFDDFSEKAYSYAKDNVTQAAIRNRTALQRVMRKAGFTTIRLEWWHFDYKKAKSYPIVDLKF